MHEEQKDNQAKKLQQLFREVNNQEASLEDENTYHNREFVEIDVLQLPPRSEVHQTSKWGIHFHITSPWVRFTFTICVLLAVIFIVYFFIGEKVILFFNS